VAWERPRKRSRKDRSPTNRYGRRPVGTRLPLPVVVIVCDDSATAPAYLEHLKREVRQFVTLRIYPASCGEGSPARVVDRAIRHHDDLSLDQQPDETSRDCVWALIDLEHEDHRRRQAKHEKQRAEEKGVRVALSDPCYEVWTLLHLEDAGSAFANCAQVIERVRYLWRRQFGEPVDRKARIDYGRIISMRHEAAARARKHHRADDPSWTEVYQILENIEEHRPKSPSDVPS